MKTEKNILIAFALNLGFSLFELLGGLKTGSVAILSDAVHDLGDAVGIGISWILEKVSKKQPDAQYTYGYGRFSLLGSVITNLILIFGSLVVACNAIHRIFVPSAIHYDGMMLLAAVGVLVNLVAVFVTRGGDSLNQKAVNLHMLEDVLSWVIVLMGAVFMKLTKFVLIDALLSMGVAGFMIYHGIKALKEGVCIFLDKMPQGIHWEEIEKEIYSIEGVCDVHHIHIWSVDGEHHAATLHLVAGGGRQPVKMQVKALLQAHGIGHSVIEMESETEDCRERHCHTVGVKGVHTCCHHH